MKEGGIVILNRLELSCDCIRNRDRALLQGNRATQLGQSRQDRWVRRDPNSPDYGEVSERLSNSANWRNVPLITPLFLWKIELQMQSRCQIKTSYKIIDVR